MSKIKKLFDKFDGDHIEFERIPIADRRHVRPDICALVYLHEKLGGKVGDNAICSAEHDQVWFTWGKLGRLTEDDVLYLTRCGVFYDSDTDSLSSFV